MLLVMVGSVTVWVWASETTNLCLQSLLKDSISNLRSSDEELRPKGTCIILLQASCCFILVRIKFSPEVTVWFDDLHGNYRCGLEVGARGKELCPCSLYPCVLYRLANMAWRISSIMTAQPTSSNLISKAVFFQS